MTEKDRIVDEFPCSYCSDGIAAIWIAPQVAKMLYELMGSDIWVYRCDRCGEKFAPGLITNGTDDNQDAVVRRKKMRNKQLTWVPRQAEAFGDIVMNPDVEGCCKPVEEKDGGEDGKL